MEGRRDKKMKCPKSSERSARRFVNILLVFLVILSAGCTTAAKVPEYRDPAKPITVTAGDLFIIVLESNRTTGYMWRLSASFNKTMLEAAGSEYVPDGGNLVGTPGMEKFTLKALKEGKATVPLEYVRPWETSVPPAKKAIFNVTIR